ncbi:IS110 family transposase [Methylotenera versatilis]|uniref:Transposase IS116/IS110/IS902 family protein n=1 Tax=Methylotenera versatilis (strain 301) TaxID=666681 RepID=D7DJB9_METV0|nr:IS110 family transposase [Methylotenera versatilis]ADI30154.1 transposase IS116/IS110/IS902 family protein [Methylotenera versatilis 301]
MTNITTIGIDLAKEVFAVCAMDVTGAVFYHKILKRDAFVSWAEQLPPSNVVMEACGSSHHWGRWFAAHGHTAKLIAAEFVQPFRKSAAAKNDRNDAEAIAIASRQATMRYVSVKSIAQQEALVWHRLREGYKEERTAHLNRIRGLLGEFGIWPPRSADKLIRLLPTFTIDISIPAGVRSAIVQTLQYLNELHTQMAKCDQQIALHVKSHPAAQRLTEMTGIGTLTASATSAMVVDAKHYKNGRQFAAWLGLVPRQMSSGGKAKLGRTTRRGDTYLRSLLVQGAKSTLQAALRQAPEKASRLQQWIVQIYMRVGYHKTVVAIANKHARMMWAILAKNERYDALAWQRNDV